ncbi:MAG TPA: S8 family serine peptidase [Actinomycetota bacterium]|nr:S8 family serine peptidase [Actinomycetota bacterium]
MNIKRILTVLALLAVIAPAGAASAPPPQGRALVADAGDSAFLAEGMAHGLSGMAWGGRAPYRFSWSGPGGTARFTDAAAASTAFDTRGLKSGDYMLSLSVRDAAGRSARDSVKIRVFETKPRTILEESDTPPFGLPDEMILGHGADSPDGQTREYPFSLPAGLLRLDLNLEWDTYVGALGVYGVNDYDLYVEGPDASYADIVSGATGSHPEKISIDKPKAGRYKAIVSAFLSVADEFRLTVGVVDQPGTSPLPEIQIPPVIRFATGAPQTLSAKAPKGGAVSWDLNFDGVFETAGASVAASFPRGTHLATVKVVKNGFEIRRTVGVTVLRAGEIAQNTTPFVIVGIGDSGINPYHDEFSAASYPDPEVLRITEGFSKHPSAYIPGYPAGTPALPVTLGKGYLPEEDKNLWTREAIQFQKLYWIPGTKIVGAIDWTDSSGSNANADTRPILDDDGHGTESSSVSVGNRYGNCPACLLVFAEGLQGDDYLVTQSWIDFVSMSVGSLGNVGFGIFDAEPSRVAAERGQTVLFAAGNGFGNAFDAPMSTYTSATAGPDWHVIVGAARTDNRRPINGDAAPVDISSWGDGTIPAACKEGTVSMCNFGGTSAATPLTAGVFGQVLREVRRAIGDTGAGQRPGQVVAQGVAISKSPYLRDGKLTRAELWDIVLHTAEPFGEEGVPVPPYTHTWPGPRSTDFLMGGYGLATPESAEHAIDVALGRAPIPHRPVEDTFFAYDKQVRTAMWGEWDSDEDSVANPGDLAGAVSVPQQAIDPDAISSLTGGAPAELPEGASIDYYLHHRGGCPELAPPADPAGLFPSAGYTFMDRENSDGDDEPCPNTRLTTVAAYFRPVGIWAAAAPVGRFLPAGSGVDASVFLTMDHPMALVASSQLLAGKRIVGSGASQVTPVVDVMAARCRAGLPGCWTEVKIRFVTDRPIGAHERLTFQVGLRSSEGTYFGYEGDHASKVSITPAVGASASDLVAVIDSPADAASLTSSTVTLRGTATFGDVESESLRKVEVSIDDPLFGAPIAATLGEPREDGTVPWSAAVSLPGGAHTVFARALQDRRASERDSVRLTVGAQVLGIGKAPLPATGIGGPLAGILPVLLACAGALALRRRDNGGRISAP